MNSGDLLGFLINFLNQAKSLFTIYIISLFSKNFSYSIDVFDPVAVFILFLHDSSSRQKLFPMV